MKPIVRNVAIATGVAVAGVGGYYLTKRYLAKRAALKAELEKAMEDSPRLQERRKAVVTEVIESSREAVKPAVVVGFTRGDQPTAKVIKLESKPDHFAAIAARIDEITQLINEDLERHLPHLTTDLIEAQRERLHDVAQALAACSLNATDRRVLNNHINRAWHNLSLMVAQYDFTQFHEALIREGKVIECKPHWQDEWFSEALNDVSHRQYGRGYFALTNPQTQRQAIIHLTLDGNLVVFNRSQPGESCVLHYAASMGLEGLLGESSQLNATDLETFFSGSYLDRLAN